MIIITITLIITVMNKTAYDKLNQIITKQVPEELGEHGRRADRADLLGGLVGDRPGYLYV